MTNKPIYLRKNKNHKCGITNAIIDELNQTEDNK